MNDDDSTKNLDEDESPSPFSAPIESFEPKVVINDAPSTVVAPVVSLAPVQPVIANVAERSSAGVIVLQWLTYAFWGWLILGLVWLMAVVTSNAIAGADVDSMIPYAIAASLVLLPIAFVTDLFYRRHEPVKKSGAATVIMVIHVVIFALLGIGSLIITVFTVLSMFVGTGGALEEQTAAIVTELFATFLYAAAFVRTLNPFKTRKLALFYGLGMLAVSIIVLALGVFGPMVKAVTERDDRRIETNLSSVQSSISDYVDDNKKLPEALGDVTYDSPDAGSLVKDGLVRYEKVASPKAAKSGLFETDKYASTEYRYKLCVTYKGSSNSDYDNSYSSSRDEYSSYLYVSGHDAGDVCYKLSADSYGSSVIDDNTVIDDTAETLYN